MGAVKHHMKEDKSACELHMGSFSLPAENHISVLSRCGNQLKVCDDFVTRHIKAGFDSLKARNDKLLQHIMPFTADETGEITRQCVQAAVDVQR